MNINEIVTFGSDKCCGCTACMSVCPKQCISMEVDGEGFLYPLVDQSLCIDCEACVRTCPFYHPSESHKPEEVYAAINTNEGIRMESSSGGVFTMMAEKVINDGGVVFGAKYTADWQVEIVPAETIEELAAFRGSKYLQARMGNSLKQCKQYLRDGRKVLFSGTPCQIAGLKHYLRKDYDNLIAVDFVCHGVPSPKVWERYLKEVTEAGKRAIQDIKFRDKPQGWKRFNFTLNYDEADKSYSMSSYNGDNHYMRAFLSDMILRPSCYNCQAKSGRSQSDITIGDFWGIETVLPTMDDDKGTSLVLVHTEKGKQIFADAQVKTEVVAYADAFAHNPAIEHSARAHAHRQNFFEKLDQAPDLLKLIDKELKPTYKQQLRRYYWRFKSKVKRILLGRSVGGVNHSSPAKDQSDEPGVTPVSSSRFEVKDISFRSKASSWKGYEMKIRLSKKRD
jgi:coenzyme F420-reducing hydrogenase beta subunit